MGIDIDAVFPKVLFTVGPISIKDTVLQAWIVAAVLAGLAFWARNKYRTWEPKTWQLTIEYIVEYVDGLIHNARGRAMPELTAYLTTMISFIVIANLLGLLPVFQSPTRDLNTTLALSLVSLGSTIFYGMKVKGVVGIIKNYLNPLNVMGDLSRMLSMALRLFGNVVAG